MDAPLRASDQDRREAVLALSDAFAEGRLDADEFERRQSQAQEAVYLHDLDPLFADLPSRVAPTTRVPTPVPATKPGRRAPHPAAFAAFALLSAAGTVAMVALAIGAVASGHLLWLLVPMLALVVMRRARRRAYAYAALRGAGPAGFAAYAPGPPWAGAHHRPRPPWHDHR